MKTVCNTAAILLSLTIGQSVWGQIDFFGLEHFPINDATLTLTADGLLTNGRKCPPQCLGSDGQDGVDIRLTPDITNFAVTIEGIGNWLAADPLSSLHWTLNGVQPGTILAEPLLTVDFSIEPPPGPGLPPQVAVMRPRAIQPVTGNWRAVYSSQGEVVHIESGNNLLDVELVLAPTGIFNNAELSLKKWFGNWLAYDYGGSPDIWFARTVYGDNLPNVDHLDFFIEFVDPILYFGSAHLQTSMVDSYTLVQEQYQLNAPTGDFDGDGALTCGDVNLLTAEIAAGGGNPAFDMNGDGVIDGADLSFWLNRAGNWNLPGGGAYLPGDANLDGVVDGLDFTIWNGNKFTLNNAWCSGDFNADGAVDGLDFTQWNANKFQASGLRGILPSSNAVPEPQLGIAMLLALAWISKRSLGSV